MPEDNVYPNTGEYFGLNVPADQTRSEETEKSDVVREMPIAESILENLDKRIAFYKSIDSIAEGVLTIPDEFMHAVAANKIVVANLQKERDDLEVLIRQYK